MLHVEKYKLPHKLSLLLLCADLRPINIYKEVVNQKTIPISTDTKARFQCNAERLTAAAVTQTYHYIIESGLKHRVLTTDKALYSSR
ncbi:hypothetical protein F5883DRAFT_585454 [Diaporthe sp. PMI_573]|nr:hypothetical protein F5883DRAFT_585454 [Diaporthaceae sp. PMI_573]